MMRVRKTLPSHFLPSFLLQDLRYGEANQHPVLGAVDAVVQAIGEAAALRTLDLDASMARMSEQSHRMALEGITTETLPVSERSVLVEHVEEIRLRKGSLFPIRLLANLFLPSPSLSQGFPFKMSRLKRASCFRLGARDARKRTVFIRCAEEPLRERKAEFMRNVQGFLPHGIGVVIASPKRERAAAPRFCLGRKRVWDGRRL
jgi:hypothetical protein